MKRWFSPVVVILTLWVASALQADPSKYPQFAQQTLPPDIKPEFISVDTLAAQLKNGAKPLLVDVRSAEEFKEAHIAGAISEPLDHFQENMHRIPRERATILY
jgi:3-mercaptopyruvate sulfurtransferase SseA